MKKGNNRKIILAALSLALAFTVGCTKERSYDAIFKDAQSKDVPRKKNLVDTEAEYLYVPSAVTNTRTTDATFPGYMGDAKIVRLQYAEDVLRVLEVEKDRFGNNRLNDKPVLEVPIEHLDFRCAPDADGECTNKEEKNEEITWSKRKYFKVLTDKLEVQEVSYLPIEITNLFYPCYNKVGTSFAELKIEQDAINIQLEESYKSRLECSDVQSLSDLTFRVTNHYSLVKLNKVATPGYKALEYPRKEENMFGFFTTNTLKLDQDNNQSEDSEKVFANRWAPGKKVVYHLTENFNRPENAKIKRSTEIAVININRSLEKAGAQMRLELSSQALTDREIGDIRNSSIVLVEDPINYGLLGYGPTAANPRTGEIVQGRTMMYLGILRQIVKNTYEDFVEEKMNAVAKAQSKVTSETDASGDLVPVDDESVEDKKEEKFILADNLKKFSNSRARPNVVKYVETKAGILAAERSANVRAVSATQPRGNGQAVGSSSTSAPVNVKKLKERALRLEKRKIQLAHIAKMEDDFSVKDTVMSLHCYLSAEQLDLFDTLEQEIDRLITEVGLKPWNQLTVAEQTKVMDTLLPVVYVPTLVHEMGHNLGLRHNFAGSEDKENFYSPEELASLEVHHDVPYSTVMEYSFKQTNELPVMGKYDIAALQYGYAEKIQLKSGELVSIDQFRAAPAAEAKEFKYCTDEHADVNPNCNRFDEGTSLVEISKHLIDAYEQNYHRRNFRNKRLSFSVVDDMSYASRIRNTMFTMRSTLERYEDIKKTFGLADDNELWKTIDWLKDLQEASRIAGKFFINVLNTPDTICAVAQASAPNRIVAVAPIRMISTNAISCFDAENIQLNPAFVVVGEAGKSFQSRKDPHSTNAYIDQIDVRGIWIDKLLAAKMLVGRITGIEAYDEFTGNYLDLSDMRDEVQSSLTSLLLDEVVAPVPIRTKSGQVLVAELQVSLFDKEEGSHPHRIPKHLFSFVRRSFGLPNGVTDLSAQLSKILRVELPSREQLNDEKSLLNATTVFGSIPSGSNPGEFISAKIGLSNLFVNMGSEVAATNVVSREVVQLLTGLGEEKVAAILELLAEEKPLPDDASIQEKLAYSLGGEVIVRFLEGGFKDPIFYEHMLLSLAQ